jgi:hypothetical protein
LAIYVSHIFSLAHFHSFFSLFLYMRLIPHSIIYLYKSIHICSGSSTCFFHIRELRVGVSLTFIQAWTLTHTSLSCSIQITLSRRFRIDNAKISSITHHKILFFEEYKTPLHSLILHEIRIIASILKFTLESHIFFTVLVVLYVYVYSLKFHVKNK